MTGAAKLFWIASGLLLFFGGAYLVYAILRFIFARSVFLGLLFVFFGLPALFRFLFIFFFTFLAGLWALFPFGGTRRNQAHEKEDEDEDVIDVKYKID